MAHGDVKPDNSMITDDFRVVLIDFGHSRKVNELIKHEVGTDVYRGPEVSDKDLYSIARADYFALGCTFFTIMFQDIPFNEKKICRDFFYEKYRTNVEEAWLYFYGTHYKSFRSGYEYHSNETLQMVFSLMNPNPIERPRTVEVYNHPWI